MHLSHFINSTWSALELFKALHNTIIISFDAEFLRWSPFRRLFASQVNGDGIVQLCPVKLNQVI